MSYYNHKPPTFSPSVKRRMEAQAEYETLHWTEQLKRKPLRTRRRFDYPTGDYDTRIDNWDTEE